MKIEKINDSQIRCTLSSFDLLERNINFIDFAYGSEKSRSLFQEMMHKAGQEFGFDAEASPLMIEAIPSPEDSIILIITKVDEPEELDTRFSKFTQPMETMSASLLQEEKLDGIEWLHSDAASSLPAKEAETLYRIYIFDDIDSIAKIAARVYQCFDGNSTLYKEESASKYYLLLECTSGDEETSKAFAKVCNTLSEFAPKMDGNALIKAHFDEHYKILIREHALSKLALL